MRSSRVLERLTVNAKVATVLGSNPASSDTMESEGRQMKQSWNTYEYIKRINQKIPLLRFFHIEEGSDDISVEKIVVSA